MVKMLRCQNGWPASEDRKLLDIRTFLVPGTDNVKIALRADVAPLFLEMGRWWNEEVEELKAGWCWGHAFRKVRAGSDLSNHAGGGAADFNAPLHPLGKEGTLGSKKNRVIAKAKSLGLRSGAGYSGRKDDMHVEGDVPLEQAYKLVKALQSQGGVILNPKPPAGPMGRMTLKLRVPRMGLSNPHEQAAVLDYQEVVNKWYPNLRIVEDGIFGQGTHEATIFVQKAHGLEQDGEVGPATYGALGFR